MESVRIEMEMGVSHRDFYRTLPAAMADTPYSIDADRRSVTVENDNRRLTIGLGPEQERRIALMRVPYTAVEFDFQGYDQGQIDTFMDYFMARYQRGGG